MPSFDQNILNKIKDKAKSTANALRDQYGLSDPGNSWPQTKYEPINFNGLNLYPNHKTRGFLPPVTISPILEEEKKVGLYKYKDWRGHLLDLNNTGVVDTKDKFDEGINIPKRTNELVDFPYSTRDNYLIFNDNSTDYFRHGLHIIDRLTPIENPTNGISNIRLANFSSTPFENNDPIIYGFEIIIDDVSSPLLNGSVLDFLRNYSNISEIGTKIQVYEDFKQQFVKFFRTKTTVDIDENMTSFTKLRNASYPESDSNKSISQQGKKAYMNYYLKKVDGLDKLIERNTPNTKNFLVDYNKDVITLSFSEDVSMSVGALSHLYKLLYWSKPNGKGLVPENLLRFNCDIIISEVRNFKRVRKAVNSGELEVIKDNVSRYIYSLKECQFYFNSMPHPSSVDLGSISPFGEGSYPVQFDYKYSTIKMERFTPTTNGFGQYIGYDGGAVWKIGNISGSTSSISSESSIPKFYTTGTNTLNNNGVNSPLVTSVPKDNLFKRSFIGETTDEDIDGFERFKINSLNAAKELGDQLVDTAIRATARELQSYVNTRAAILNKTLNKILNSNSIRNIRPPANVYTDKGLTGGQRIFYDVRGQLINFLGNSAGNAFNITGGGFNPR